MNDPIPFKPRSTAADELIEQLKESERIFALLVRSVKDYGIFMLDRHGSVLTWNDGAARMLGYTGEEIIGQHLSIFYTEDAIAARHPQEELNRAVETGSHEEEGWRLKKDRSQFWANVVITPVYENQQLLGFAKVIRDLSERKQFELERNNAIRSAEVFRLLVSAVKDYAIFMLDPDGIVRTWNEGAQRAKGYSAEEIIGKHFSVFYTQEAKQIEHPQKELEIAKAKGWYEEEGWRVRKDGSLFWANVLITALYERGELKGFAKITRDLSERRNAEQAREKAFDQVARANEELEQLAYSVSHELQEPISSVISYSKLLASRYTGRLGEDADEFLGKIKTGARTTRRLVDDLWMYARISKPVVVRTDLATGPLFRDAKEEIAKLIDATQAQIINPPYERFPSVTGVRDQLLFVFKELLTNAIKHYHGQGAPVVEVSISHERHGWTFSFKDNGPGIDKFFTQQVFNLYQRLNAKPDETGTGMGLPISKKIVEEQHAGKIGFQSADGNGSTFFIWLPQQTT